MITQIAEIKLFYPMLFLTIGFIAVVIGVVLIKFKNTDLFNNIFNRHVDEHIDTTDKFSKAHTEVITCLPQHYEKELHALETAIKDTDDKLIALAEDVNKKLDMIIDRIIKLENKY